MKYIFILMVIMMSCGPQKKGLEQQRAEVMKIHDDSMAKMGELRAIAFKLQESIQENPDSSAIKKVISELESADEGMMTWMEEYVEPADDQLEEFYTAEKVKIEKVANDIYKSLENAQKYIDK